MGAVYGSIHCGRTTAGFHTAGTIGRFELRVMIKTSPIFPIWGALDDVSLGQTAASVLPFRGSYKENPFASPR